jgi:hypothetical protein
VDQACHWRGLAWSGLDWMGSRDGGGLTWPASARSRITVVVLMVEVVVVVVLW